ncbi:metal ABC transporter solute-binding protein, Zn/Mn family [Caldalkalibacillus salinus]|uniref:metal ABC transporter solute-binding protein, Zn/Mn family n=1 Tax=Caldalkalibacillus salinus TaxID=2803787 RepID=UPI0019218A4C|nr:zinc ABC transporter substrate-binding protein [Caldalkalibacillus salinus]
MISKHLLKTTTVFLILVLALIGCRNAEVSPVEGDTPSEGEEQETLLIYTSMYPLYFFANEIAGEHAEVVNLVPPGVDPHNFEPTAQDIIALSDADIFIYNGGGFEHWLEKIIESVNSDTMTVLDSTADIQLLKSENLGQSVLDQENVEHGHEDTHSHDEHSHDSHDGEHANSGEVEASHDEHGTEEEDHDHSGHDDGHEHDDHNNDHAHDHGEYDPHVWLDPVMAKQQAEAVLATLIEQDPANAEDYEENFSDLAQRLDSLNDEFNELSDHVVRRDFIVSHSAFGYIAHRYDLNEISVTGLSPSNEPSQQQLRQIIEFANDRDIQYILFENFVTPRVAEVVKDQLGLESLIIHNLEGLTEEEVTQGEDYFTLMEKNLEVLREALGYN